MSTPTHLARLFALALVFTFSQAAYAQESTAGTADPNYEVEDVNVEDDDGMDLGWLGLLGLAGLAGLMKRPERHVVTQTETIRPRP